MAYVQVTYPELLTHADKLGVKVLPWDHCKPSYNGRLGTGASMNVFSGTYEFNGTLHKVAFKTVNARLTNITAGKKRSSTLRDIKQEIRIMGCLRGHSRIVQLLGVSFDDHMPVLILELAKSNLEDYLQEGDRVEWKIKLGFVYDIALGLEAIHKIKVVHGDLKAANILLFDSDNDQIVAKISDFGFSSTDFSVQEGRSPGFSYNFRSRESFDVDLKEWNGKPMMDIYSYGLVVYQIAHDGTIPFEYYDISEMDNMKKEGIELAILMKLLPNDTPMEIREIMTATVRNIPSERLNLDEIKSILKKSKEWNQVNSHDEAKIAFESLAQMGLKETIYVSKMMKLFIPSSLKKSIFLEYQQLADAGDVVSQQRLGSCWSFGFGTDQDYFKAFECYAKAAESGNVDAQNDLGICYQYSQGVTKDSMKAVELYTKAADAGNTFAQYNLGVCYENGEGVAKDYAKMIELYTKAADTGNIYAQNNLGVCYENGEGVTKNYSKAVELYTKAAEAGNTDAQNNLGICYQNGLGVIENYIKAVELYTKAADAGDANAQASLGYCYENGDGVTKDYDKAVGLYIKAVDAGNAYAQCSLGDCYKNGQGVAKDYKKAIELYAKATDAGNAHGQYSLGVCYEKGEGVTKDYIKAVELYTEAAEAGNTDAQNSLGFCYKNGYGVIKNYTKAVELFTKAADAGNVSAQYNLGVCYEHGQGVTKDCSEAKELYAKAAAGNTIAQHNLEGLARKGHRALLFKRIRKNLSNFKMDAIFK